MQGNILLLGVIGFILVGCEVNEKMAIDKASEMVASQLKDPSSAKFSLVRFVEEEYIGDRRYGYLCGFVNSKNSFGGYTGSLRFSAAVNYSKGGNFSVSYIELEEGQNAEEMTEGVTYFEHFYWQKRCIAGNIEKRANTENKAPLITMMKLSIGQKSKPSTSILTTVENPDTYASAAASLPKGTIVQVYEVVDGWIQVSPDPKSPQWIIPELLEW